MGRALKITVVSSNTSTVLVGILLTYASTHVPLRMVWYALEVPELRLLYHTQYDISESFHGTPQIVLFDSYDKFMSI